MDRRSHGSHRLTRIRNILVANKQSFLCVNRPSWSELNPDQDGLCTHQSPVSNHERMKDTSPEIEEIYRQMLMEKSGADRIKMGVSMFETAKKFVEASLPEGLSEEEKRKAMIMRIYPELSVLTTDDTD